MNSEKSGNNFIGYHLWVKILLVLLSCLLLVITAAGVLILIVAGEFGLLTHNQKDFRHILYARVANEQLYSEYDFYSTMSDAKITDSAQIQAMFEQCTVPDLFLTVTSGTDDLVLFNNLPEDVTVEWQTKRTISIRVDYEVHDYNSKLSYEERIYQVTLSVPAEKTQGSAYAWIYATANALHNARWGIVAITLISAALVILLFVLLLLVAGRHPGEAQPRCNKIDNIPYDIFVALYIGFIILQIALFVELDWIGFTAGFFVAIAAAVLIYPPLFYLFFMSTATRCKCSTIWKNTLVWRILVLLFRGLRWIWHHIIASPIRTLGRWFARLVRGIPSIWKGTLLLIGLSFVEMIWMVGNVRHSAGILLWFLYKIITIPLILYVMLCMHHLRKGAKKLADGEMGYRIDEKYLIGGLKEHAEHLNSIGLGMNRAVEERMKSERFRTELITNVSHDIKTPLTSIINYVDLLQKEGASTEQAAEYLTVLERQALRLKKLIEDLMEASKASTGNISVNIAPCEIGILLSQALGEYQEKLDAAHLSIVLNTPENQPIIMADGRLLWRIFDNLLGNAAKYSLPYTRLYIDLAEETETVQIKFRNISGQALNVRPEELMERFVRGDASRHTEGSGLGLSIARSLVELHNGTLAIDIDGDLFKVTVTLPKGYNPTALAAFCDPPSF